MKTADAIVIGAGSVGCPAAYFLARERLDVLVLEELPAVGQGQNKAAIGGVRATHSDPAKIQLCQQSLKIFASWEQEHGFALGWKKGGYCYPVYEEPLETSLKSLLEVQKGYGLNIDWLDPDGIKAVVPGIAEEGLRGGTLSPDDGQVSPLLAAEGFRRAAAAHGARFCYKEPVREARFDGSAYVLRTELEEYSAPKVLVASGAKAKEVGALFGLEIPVVPDSHEAGISAPVAPFLDPLVVDMRPGLEGKTLNFYFGQNHEGQIIFCYTPKPLIVGEDRRATSEFLPIVAQRLLRLIPRLKNLLVRRVWRGLYPMTPDGVPIMGQVAGREGLYLGVGMCGQGFMLGPGVALNLASLMTTGKTLISEDILSSLRFERTYSGSTEALK